MALDALFVITLVKWLSNQRKLDNSKNKEKS
jgi:hypothetical protein